MVSVIRYVSGYVHFCAEDGFPERFLNLCKINGISLWNIKNDGVKVEACTSAREFEIIEKPAENSGMTVKIIKKRGLPFWAKRHKWRCGAVFGVAVAVCLVWYMSGFIWEVEIVEEDGVKINNFTETLAELGVRPGARKSEIEILDVQERLLATYPELSWVSLNIFGDKAQIEYTPATPAPEVTDTKTPSNIVAAKSGRITLVEGYSGTNAVKEGVFVAQGSLLISGIKTNADGSEELTRARGKVFARTHNKINAQTPVKADVYITSQTQTRYGMDLFGLNIPLGLKPEGEIYNHTHIPLKSDSAVLPVGVTRDEGISLNQLQIEYTDEEVKLLNLLYCVEEKREFYSEVDISSAEFVESKDEKNRILTMSIVCVENIALEKPVFVEEN